MCEVLEVKKREKGGNFKKAITTDLTAPKITRCE